MWQLYVVTVAVSLIVWVPLLSFAFWLGRRHHFISVGWYLLYWSLGWSVFSLPRQWLLRAYVNSLPERRIPLGLKVGEVVLAWHYGGRLLATLGLACVAALVLSDAADYLQPEAKGILGRVRRLREKHLILGLSMIALRLGPAIVVLALYLVT